MRVRVPVYRTEKGDFRGWHGWGFPAKLSEAQAKEHSRLLVKEGKCGSIRLTAHVGYAVCDRDAWHSQDGCPDCEDRRHAVCWLDARPANFALIKGEG